MKRIGFLSFGHWTPHPQSATRSASDVLHQSIDLAVAAEELGDLTYVEMPAVGAVFAAGATFGSVESVKAASDIYAPLAGKVSEVNDALTTAPEVLNESPEGEGWICRFTDVDQSGLSRLMSREDYLKSIGK